MQRPRETTAAARGQAKRNWAQGLERARWKLEGGVAFPPVFRLEENNVGLARGLGLVVVPSACLWIRVQGLCDVESWHLGP